MVNVSMRHTLTANGLQLYVSGGLKVKIIQKLITMKKEIPNTPTSAPAIADSLLLCTVDLNARIKEKPYYQRWGDRNIDYCKDEGKINYEGLTDCQKLCLYVFAWNSADILPGKKGILRTFGWTNYKLQKLIKELRGIISIDATFSEHTGLISGRGYKNNKKKPSTDILEKIAADFEIPLPIIFWYRIEEKDIHESKREYFRFLKHTIDSMIDSII